MRPCGNFDIRAYLDGELAADARAAFEAHLAACGRCRQDAADLAKVLALLRAAPDVPVRPDFKVRVMRAIEARPAVLARPALRARRYALAASFLLVCALAAGVYFATRGEETPAEVALRREPAAAPPPAPMPAAPTAPALVEAPAPELAPGDGRADAPATDKKSLVLQPARDRAVESAAPLRERIEALEPEVRAARPAELRAEEAAAELAEDAAAAPDAIAKDGAVRAGGAAGRAHEIAEKPEESLPSTLWVVLPETPDTRAKLAALGVARALSEAGTMGADLDGERAAALALLAGRGRWGIDAAAKAAGELARFKSRALSDKAEKQRTAAPAAAAGAARARTSRTEPPSPPAAPSAPALGRGMTRQAEEKEGIAPAPDAAVPAAEAPVAKGEAGAPPTDIKLGAPVQPSAGIAGGQDRDKLARALTRAGAAPEIDASPAARYRVLILLLPPEAIARTPPPGAPAEPAGTPPAEKTPAPPPAPAGPVPGGK
ncbi:MAG TPA: hypothetical protein DCM87_09870 [Planctomycetes bacterium]|nr:hypothetical protein [Planctomycetota bacterium]